MLFFSYINVTATAFSENNFVNKYWLIYSNLISLSFIMISIIFLGIVFLNKASHVKILNIISAYILFIYFCIISLNYNYDFFNLNLSFNQNVTLFVNLFVFAATITTLIFFLSISNVFFIEENSKVEFSFLIWFIYISAIFLISSTDFISIIILLECIAFSSYVLVGFERTNKFSATSALKYLILAAVPGGIFILGIALLYNNFGSFSQDYISIIIYSLVNNNFFENSFVDVNFIHYWKHISLYYLNNHTLFIGETLLTAAELQKAFDFFLTSLNDVLKNFNFLLIKYIKIFEASYFIKTNDMSAFQFIFNPFREDYTFDPFEEELQWLIYYEQFIEYYFFVIQELFLLQYFWTLHNEVHSIVHVLAGEEPPAHFAFSHPQALQQFPEEIRRWLGFLNYADFLRAETAFQSAQRIIANRPFCLNEFYGLLGQEFFFLTLLDSVREPLKIEFLQIDVVTENYRHAREVFYSVLRSFYLGQAKIYFFTNEFNIIQYEYITFFRLNALLAPNNWISLRVGLIDCNWENFAIFFDNEFLIENLNKHFMLFWNNYFYYQDFFLVIYLVILFLSINLFFKLTAAPFHFWAPSIYGGAPISTLTFLSVFSKLTIIFFSMYLFLYTLEGFYKVWQPLMLSVAFLSVFFSILGAFSEKIFKRFFVYSSVGHTGFMLLGISALNLDGMQGTVDYLFIYIISSLIIWFIILHLTKKTSGIVNLKGLSFNQPTLSLIFSFTIFSLSGIPPLGGFFVKYEIFYSILNSSLFLLGYLLLLLTVISFFYYLRLIKIIFFENNAVFVKNKNIGDVKLRILSFCFFILPFFMLFAENPLLFILKDILIKSL